MSNKFYNEMFNPARIFCVGLNYTDHINEMNSKPAERPVIFLKPLSSLSPLGRPIVKPTHGQSLHHEVEVVVRIGKGGGKISKNQALDYINAISLGLDLTLRDVQSELKRNGQPWEISKAFDGSAVIGNFMDLKGLSLDNIDFSCSVNEELRQLGNTKNMIFSIPILIEYLSSIWQLNPGDLIFTGTPSGVGELKVDDQICISSPQIGNFSWKVANFDH